MGPTPVSTVLSPEEEAAAVAFRQHTQLPLDNCLYALQATIPRLTRSALHRLFQRHGISRLPLSDYGKSPVKKKFKAYPIGYLHVDFAEVRTEQGKVYLFVAIDFRQQGGLCRVAAPRDQDARRGVPAACAGGAALHSTHKALIDNGKKFSNIPHQPYASRHIFDRVCDEHGIEHRFTKLAHLWTNGQVERMNRTLKEATVLRYHYETTAQLNEHLPAFLLAYNHARRLKTLRGLPPHEFIRAQHQKNPAIFTRDPTQLTLGLYS